MTTHRRPWVGQTFSTIKAMHTSVYGGFPIFGAGPLTHACDRHLGHGNIISFIGLVGRVVCTCESFPPFVSVRRFVRLHSCGAPLVNNLWVPPNVLLLSGFKFRIRSVRHVVAAFVCHVSRTDLRANAHIACGIRASIALNTCVENMRT